MHKKTKIVLGISSVLAFMIFFAAILGYLLVTKSFPKINGTVAIKGLNSEVRVYRDGYGVPHVFARSERDAYIAAGYIHAQERLWQMELERRVGLGRLSEIFGEPALPIDRLFHTLGFRRVVQKIEENLDEPTRLALQAYAIGINQYIDTHKGSYPIEFDMLNIEPEPWKIEHSLLISRLMAWELNYSRWIDLTLAALVQCVGLEKAKEAFPWWPDDAPLIIPEGMKGIKIAESLRPFFDAEHHYQLLFGKVTAGAGSNAWAVSSAKSASGKPILANDPHLFLMAPGRWYEIHLCSPDLDVAGMSIPGVPFIVVGRNRNIAWGVTNAMMDDEDFYVEQVDSIQHPKQYRYNNTWLPIKEDIDTIFVKNALPVVLSIYRTHRGPIINKIEPGAATVSSLISIRWTGYEISNETGTFYNLNRAKNWNEFKEGLKSFCVPAQNFVYADVDGNIGYYTGGKLPIRSVKGPTFPFAGWNDENEWKGFVPFNDMPHDYNPARGFIVTANNKIIDDAYPYYISNFWEPPWRSIRLHELLKEQDKFSVEDIERMQCDIFSLQAKEFVPIILKAFDSLKVENKDVRTALEYFKNWNYETRVENISTTLFQSTLNHIIRNTFEDEMGEQLFALYDTLASTPLTAISRLLRSDSSSWFDDIRTQEIENKNSIIRKSVSDAIVELHALLGGQPKEWQWGRVHTVVFEHIFGLNKLLRPFVNVGPYPVGGTHATINVGQYFFSQPYTSTVGASMRQVMNLADVNDTRVVMPPGQSGNLFYKHYDDQITLWLNGGYRTRPMDQARIESECSDVLRLKPQQ